MEWPTDGPERTLEGEVLEHVNYMVDFRNHPPNKTRFNSLEGVSQIKRSNFWTLRLIFEANSLIIYLKSCLFISLWKGAKSARPTSGNTFSLGFRNLLVPAESQNPPANLIEDRYQGNSQQKSISPYLPARLIQETPILVANPSEKDPIQEEEYPKEEGSTNFIEYEITPSFYYSRYPHH